MVHAARRVSSSIVPLTFLGALLLLGGCSRESGDWKSAQGADTIEAYDGFLKQHPQSEFAAQALERTKQLAEERDWQVATQADTADAYQQFLTQYPEGKWAQEARVRIENFNVMDGGASAATPAAATPTPPASEAAPAKEPVAASAAPVAVPAAVPAAAPVAAPVAAPATASAPAPAPAPKPAAKPAAAEKPVPAAAGRFRVQLGAFSSEDTARAEWRRASGRFAELKSLSPLVTAAQTGSGKLYRLQTALASEASARDLCARLKAGGQACIYVPVRN